jgi:plasmid stabilization system protein ParE
VERAIESAVASLDRFPERTRLRGGFRELVIAFGQRAYIARYRVTGERVVVTRIFRSSEAR